MASPEGVAIKRERSNSDEVQYPKLLKHTKLSNAVVPSSPLSVAWSEGKVEALHRDIKREYGVTIKPEGNLDNRSASSETPLRSFSEESLVAIKQEERSASSETPLRSFSEESLVTIEQEERSETPDLGPDRVSVHRRHSPSWCAPYDAIGPHLSEQDERGLLLQRFSWHEKHGPSAIRAPLHEQVLSHAVFAVAIISNTSKPAALGWLLSQTESLDDLTLAVLRSNRIDSIAIRWKLLTGQALPVKSESPRASCNVCDGLTFVYLLSTERAHWMLSIPSNWREIGGPGTWRVKLTGVFNERIGPCMKQD